jgi:hypothetical protein
MATAYNNLTVAKPIRVSKVTGTLPASTQTAKFTISGGKVIISDIIGEVTTIIQNQACNLKLVSNPTVGADVDLCAVLDINADVVGTVYSITGTLADAMIATTSGAGVSQASPITVNAGTIDVSTSATNTGSVKWTLFYIPVEAGAKVV